MLENYHRHQRSTPIFQGAKENQISDPLIAHRAEIMCRRRPDFRQIDSGDEFGIGIIQEKIHENEQLPEHPLGEGVVNIPRRFFRFGWFFRVHCPILTQPGGKTRDPTTRRPAGRVVLKES